MAASEAEKYASSDKAIVDSKLILSAYADSLESSIKKRYIEKISVIGMDPLPFPLQKYTSECLSSVTFVIFCRTSCSRPASTLRINLKLERKNKDRSVRTPTVVFVVASHYQKPSNYSFAITSKSFRDLPLL